jgi:hypothetical protein
MPEELGKIEKPPVNSFKKGRKLFFVPLIFGNAEMPEVYMEKFNRYWEQVENRIYHEMIPESGEAGCKAVSELNEKSSKIVRVCLEDKAQLEAIEDSNLLMEFMDWNRCLMIGLQNTNVISKVYNAFVETGKKRNEIIAHKLDETLKPDEIGLLFMRENHQVQIAPDIQVFYIAPPALDEIKRWIREREQKAGEEEKE